MENCFTINLGFSLLFWGYRILNATVTQHQNPEAMKLIQIFRSLLKSWHQWTLKKKQIQRVPCLNGNEAPSWNQQFQCKTTHTYSPAKQQHKSEYDKRCYLKLYQTHRHHNAHYRTIHCTSQRSDPAPPDRPQAHNIPNIKPWKITGSIPPTKIRFHHKLDPKCCGLQKGDPNHCNLNKMRLLSLIRPHWFIFAFICNILGGGS